MHVGMWVNPSISNDKTTLTPLQPTHQPFRSVAAEEGLAGLAGDGVEVVAEGTVAADAAVLVLLVLAGLAAPVHVRGRVVHGAEVVRLHGVGIFEAATHREGQSRT